MKLLRIILNYFMEEKPDFKVIQEVNSLHYVLICPKCGSRRCIENDEYWTITQKCLDCGYEKDLN